MRVVSSFLIFILSCVVQATSVYEEFASPHIPGPNCWNGALQATGLQKSYRFTHPTEFTYLISQNCVETSSPQPGSVGRIYNGDREIHAYIWVDQNTVFAKHSDGKFSSEKYQMMSREKMLSSYQYKRECGNKKTADCENTISYYSCEATQGLLKQQIERLQSVESLVQELAFSAETKMSHGDDCSSPAFLKINQVLNQIEQQVDQLTPQDILEPEYLAAWRLSVRGQIGESQSVVRAYRCKNLSSQEKFKNYQAALAAIDDWLRPANLF